MRQNKDEFYLFLIMPNRPLDLLNGRATDTVELFDVSTFFVSRAHSLYRLYSFVHASTRKRTAIRSLMSMILFDQTKMNIECHSFLR